MSILLVPFISPVTLLPTQPTPPPSQERSFFHPPMALPPENASPGEILVAEKGSNILGQQLGGFPGGEVTAKLMQIPHLDVARPLCPVKGLRLCVSTARYRPKGLKRTVRYHISLGNSDIAMGWLTYGKLWKWVAL